MRKTAEPLAKYAGTAPLMVAGVSQSLLVGPRGPHRRRATSVRTAVAELPPDPVGTVGILDETSALKQGTKTPGVQRQYLGCVGKVANGIVTVHLVVAHGPFKALLDSELFLPQSWDADRERCRQADIPDELAYRPKSDIVLESLGGSERNGWRFDWLTFDEWYGSKPGFLHALDGAAGVTWGKCRSRSRVGRDEAGRR